MKLSVYMAIHVEHMYIVQPNLTLIINLVGHVYIYDGQSKFVHYSVL